ncbi:hypothetical protein HPULCUR_002603 [Helicostylum pulchrum]|uniref:C2H2-type domain-containing protein n=1 Tax=Helicostylum pulchrum TaxID=562976 RepID=A0ABP9XS28_9FUNG
MRVPRVIVHDSGSSSDADPEPVTATEPYRVSSIYFDSDPDNMSLSSEHVEPAQSTPPLENTTRKTDTDNYTISQLTDPISKYCITKQGRLYCNFNPSVTNNRGCQTDFANNELSKLVSHLNSFHGCNIAERPHYDDDKSESSIDKFYSPFNVAEDYPKHDLALAGTLTTETDNELYKDNTNDDPDLYLESVLNSFLNLDAEEISNVIEKETFMSQQQQQQDNMPWSNDAMKSTTVSLSQLEYIQSTASSPNTASPSTTASPPAIASPPATTAQPATTTVEPKKSNSEPKKIRKPLISRVTPKVLRSVTRQSEEEPKKPITNKRKSARQELKAQPKPKRKLLASPKKKATEKQVTFGSESSSSSSLYNTTSSESTPELSKRPSRCRIIKPYPAAASVDNQQTPFEMNGDHQIYKFMGQFDSTKKQANTTLISADPQDETAVAEKRDDTGPGTESRQVIPSIPTDGLWPFEFGYGFFMKQKYHCNVTRSSGFDGCKKTFANRSVFIQHLHHAHHLDASNAMSSRESEEDNLQEKIIDMLISACLPCSFVKDKRFLNMVKSIQETSAGQQIIPTLQEAEKLMQLTFEKRQNQIKALLQEQDHISFSVHTFHPLHHADDVMVVITAFFIDTDWRIKELVIQFKTLASNDTLSVVVESVFIETVQQFDIATKIYLIVSPDFPTLNSHVCKVAPVKFQISADISKPVVMPCLDQVIQLCKTCLCRNVDTLFEPLYKIISFKAKICIYSWKGDESVNISKIVNFSKNTFSSSLDLLKEFMTIAEEYNGVCFLNTRYASDSIGRDEIMKIERLLKATTTLDESYEWLIEAT